MAQEFETTTAGEEAKLEPDEQRALRLILYDALASEAMSQRMGRPSRPWGRASCGAMK